MKDKDHYQYMFL